MLFERWVCMWAWTRFLSNSSCFRFLEPWDSYKMRSSRSQKFFKIGVLKNFAIFTGKHLCWSLFLIKLQVWNPVTSLKRDSNTVVFLWYCEIFKKGFFQRTSLVAAFVKTILIKNQQRVVANVKQTCEKNVQSRVLLLYIKKYFRGYLHHKTIFN